MARLLFGGSAALVALVAAGVSQAAAPDPERGETLARRWCAACHVVSDSQTLGTDNVPTFAAIAARPGFNAKQIARFLRDPHPKMPDMQLDAGEAGDLAAYIASLRK